MQYAKLGAAVVVTILTAIVAAMTGDSTISNSEWINIAIAGVNAAAVFAAPNVPGSMYTKAILAVLGAVLAALVSFITDGISQGEMYQLIVIAAGALGIFAVPNAPNQLTKGAL